MAGQKLAIAYPRFKYVQLTFILTHLKSQGRGLNNFDFQFLENDKSFLYGGYEVVVHVNEMHITKLIFDSEAKIISMLLIIFTKIRTNSTIDSNPLRPTDQYKKDNYKFIFINHLIFIDHFYRNEPEIV